MSDLIEIALDRMTDWQRFESLAVEIAQREGYPDVKPLGGVADEGADATVERFFAHEGRRSRTVIQVTLEKTTDRKVARTIKRLDETGQDYSKLVIVTPVPVTTELQRKLKTEVKKDHDIDLEFIERKTIVARLGETRNGLFSRYFPDVRTQLERLAAERRIASAEPFEREFLRVSCAFTFSPRATRARKALLDQALLAVLSHLGKPVTVPEVIAAAAVALGPAAPRDSAQVTASLARLSAARLVDSGSGRFALSPAGLARVEAGPLKEESERRAVVTALVDRIIASSPLSIDEATAGKLETNAKDLIVGYFRLIGLELANTFLQSAAPALVYADNVAELRDVARRGVLPVHGDALLLAFGSALSHPTQDEVAYFARCARAYMAAQVLNLDPALREFQRTRFTEKTFVLDTDVVIEAIVPERPQSAPIRALVAQLAALGAKVVVPDEVSAPA